jgi:hypothetical protein
VFALAVHGGTVFAGGSFISIGGQAREYVAALDRTTGLATAWNANIFGDIYALAVGHGVLYAGGDLAAVNGAQLDGMAALDLETGVATSWVPDPWFGRSVYALAVVGGSVYAGGDFDQVADQPHSGVVCLGPGRVSAASEIAGAAPAFGLELNRATAGGVRIRYSLPEDSRVRIRVFDVLGRLLAVPLDGSASAGTHELVWHERGADGPLASGLYFVRLETPHRKSTGRLVIVR